MDVREAIRRRRSVRSFTPEEITGPEAALLKEALVWAPSSGNLQKRAFCFVYRRDVKHALAVAALGQRFMASAPLVVVASADLTIEDRYGPRGSGLYAIQDVAASVENLMLQATGLGLGSVWVGAFDEGEVARCLNLPDHLRPVALVPVGHPAREPKTPPRVAVDEAVREIR